MLRLEELAECMVGQLLVECFEVGQLEVGQPVAVVGQLRVVAQYQHSGSFYRADPCICRQTVQNIVSVVYSTFQFYCLFSLYFSCIIALMSLNFLR